MNKLALLLALAAPLASAQDWMATSHEHVEVVPNIYMLTGAEGKMAGGAIGLLVGDEYVVLIDDGFNPLGPTLHDKIVELAGRPADFIISTHAHGDHTGANQFFAEQGAIIVAHDNLRSRMATDPQQNTGPGALPVITFSDEMTFHVNGQEAYVFHIHAAHTDGDAAILFRDANVIAPGDLLFRGVFPFIDLDSGGSVAGYKAGMQKLIDMADEETKFISGHGPVATRADVQQDLNMLVDAESLVRTLIDKGMTSEQIIAANPLQKYDETYSWNFITTERMTQTLIRSLTEEK
ncbi:MAG: MBL fold metallo-hydrolase [Gammaproteobacteria bacterium]|nr:MBL fold metallo-hydrolase [Gammaproteobacteria bacterium]